MPTYTYIKACKGALFLSHSIRQYPVLLYYMINSVHMAMLLQRRRKDFLIGGAQYVKFHL